MIACFFAKGQHLELYLVVVLFIDMSLSGVYMSMFSRVMDADTLPDLPLALSARASGLSCRSLGNQRSQKHESSPSVVVINHVSTLCDIPFFKPSRLLHLLLHVDDI